MTTRPEDDDTIQERIEALLKEGRIQEAGALVGDLHPSDVADIIERLDDEGSISLVSILPAELASEALVEMDLGKERRDLLAALTPEKGAELIEELADDDAADLMGELEVAEQQKILDALPGDTAEELIDLLRYDEETAGGRMTTDLVAVRGTLNARQALEQVRLQGKEVENFYTVFVVDGRRRLIGTLRLDDLVMADPESPIASLVEEPVSTVGPEEDQEEVGRQMARYNLAAIPVVSPDGVLLGRITFDDVIDVIEAEQTEDILRFVGVTNDAQLGQDWRASVRTRLPWLVLNLLTAAAAASVILVYENVVEQVLTLAFLAPIIAAMGGSSGSQSLAITIRRLAVEGTGSARGFVVREILIGLVIGGVLGVGIAVLAIAVNGDPMLGLVVMLAMWGNQIVAGFAGAFVPATLDRLGVDPSVASSVFVHTLTDLCGFFLLLGLASRLLLG